MKSRSRTSLALCLRARRGRRPEGALCPAAGVQLGPRRAAEPSREAQLMLPGLRDIQAKLPGVGAERPLWSLASCCHSCFEIALCFITTPWCSVRFCFVSINPAALEMLSLDDSACLHPGDGRGGGAFSVAPEGPSVSLYCAPSAVCRRGVWSCLSSLFFSGGCSAPQSVLKHPEEGDGAAS